MANSRQAKLISFTRIGAGNVRVTILKKHLFAFTHREEHLFQVALQVLSRPVLGDLHVTLKSTGTSSWEILGKYKKNIEKRNMKIEAHESRSFSLSLSLKHRSCHCTGCRVRSSTSVLAGGCPEVDCRIVSNRSLCLCAWAASRGERGDLSFSLTGDTGPYSSSKPFSACWWRKMIRCERG